MENDQRLTPLPVTSDLPSAHIDYSPGYAAGYDDTHDSKRSIRQYVNVVYKRLPIILAITILVTAAASFYSFRQPSIYQAQTELIIEPRKLPATQKDAININFGDDQKYYNTQLQLLQNQDLMRRVVIALGLHREANLFNNENRGLLAGIRSIFSGEQKAPASGDNSLPVVSEASLDPDKDKVIQLTPEEKARAESYAATLVGGLTVQQLDRTNIVHVNVKSSNPVLAAKVSDKVAELFIKEDAERETAGAQQAFVDLRASIEDLKAAIIQQENDYIAEMRAAALPLQEKGGELRASNLEGLLAQWREAQNETGKIQAMYDAAVNASGKGDILSVIPDNKAIQDARSQNLKRQADLEKRIEEIDKRIDEKKQKREELLAIYTPAYSKVLATDAEIKELEEQKIRVSQEVSAKIKSEGAKLVKDAEREGLASLGSQLSAARQREARQRVAFEQAAAKANVE